MVKLLENTFRAVNIGLVNEMALMCHKMDINVWEVIDAAKTKPFGFMPFYPGPGLGGHCIPIDPFYLSWKARQTGFECRFIELAGQVNGVDARVRGAARGGRAELREEAAERLARAPVRRRLQEGRWRRAGIARARHPGVAVRPRGPCRLRIRMSPPRIRHQCESVPFETASRCDCSIIATDHAVFDYKRIAALPLVVGSETPRTSPHVFRL